MFINDANLTNKRHVPNLEALARRRAGLVARNSDMAIGFSLKKELHEIKQAKQLQAARRLKKSKVEFTQMMYYEHSDEYRRRLETKPDLAKEYDPTTAEGQARIKQYEALKAKVFNVCREAIRLQHAAEAAETKEAWNGLKT